MCVAVSASSGQDDSTSGDDATSPWVVSAPMVKLAPSAAAAMPQIPGTAARSTSAVGVASRSFIAGSRLCPPARMRASPSACSSAAASSSVDGRW